MNQSFDTPQAIRALIDVGIGDVVVRASDRTATVVEIVPTRPGRRSDEDAVEAARVRFSDGRLEIRCRKPGALNLLWRPGSVNITVDLPTGSDLEVTAGAGAIDVTGSLGTVRAKALAGDVRVADAETLEAQSSAGDLDAGRVGISALLKSTAGGVTVDEVEGTARIRASAGEIVVGRSTGEVEATAPYGRVRVREAVSGSLVLTSSYADVEVGIPEGTAARLDVEARHGRIRNDLTATDAPGEAVDRVEVTARTGYGSVVIRRA